MGTEEVHGGLVDLPQFNEFLQLIKIQLDNRNLGECWPCLFVAQIGTNLHTTVFNPQAARNLLSILAPLGSMVKGHYTDWVENPEGYPITGMGGANVGPEFSAEEYHALVELEKLEQKIIHRTPLEPSHFIETLQHAVFASNRWKKWLLPDEIRTDFWNLPAGRREWLIKTGSRYIWTDESVNAARNQLYQCLSNHGC